MQGSVGDFMNLFASLIGCMAAIQANVRRRRARHAG